MSEIESLLKKKRFLYLSLCPIIVFVLTSCQPSKSFHAQPRLKSTAPPLTLSARNIIVTQDEYTREPCGSGRVQVWNYHNGNYENNWTAKTFHNHLVKIGDIDGDPKREIITLASCPITETKQGEKIEAHKFFLCVYKEEEPTSKNDMGLWKTTYYDDLKNNIKEDENFWPKEIILADIDDDAINEIIVITGHCLAVYKYDPQAVDVYNNSEGVLLKITEVKPQISEEPTRLKSVKVLKINDKGEKQIIVSANQERLEDYGYGFHGWYVDQTGYVFFYNYNDSSLELSSYISVDAFLTCQSLCFGDLDNDKSLELCSTGYKQKGDLLQGYLFIWNFTSGWELHEIPIGAPENLGVNFYNETNAPWNPIDIGDLNSNHPGDEIVFALKHQMLVTLCYWKGEEILTTLNNATLYDYFFVEIGNVFIADTDNDGKNDVVVIGAGKSESKSGRFYLEIFDNNLTRKWYRLGGYPRESEIRSASVG